MPQKQVDVIVDDKLFLTFSPKEAKEIRIEHGKRYRLESQGTVDGVAQFVFIEDEYGDCEVRKK